MATEIDRSEPFVDVEGYMAQVVTYEVDTLLGPVPIVDVERCDANALLEEAA